MIPSFKIQKGGGHPAVKPRIQMLEVRHRDRPDKSQIAWLVVERQMEYSENGETAAINISYQDVTSDQSCGEHCFHGGYFNSFNNNRVSLTPTSSSSDGAIFLDLPGLYGQRIGTYLLNEVVQWVKQWPEATVSTVKLIKEGNPEWRRRYYRQFGLELDSNDHSLPIRADKLITVETWKENIIEHQMTDFLVDTLSAKEKVSSELRPSKFCVS